MRLTLRDDLILIPVTVVYQGREIKVPDVVVDTGSATTMLSTDVVAQVGIMPELSTTFCVSSGVLKGQRLSFLVTSAIMHVERKSHA